MAPFDGIRSHKTAKKTTTHTHKIKTHANGKHRDDMEWNQETQRIVNVTLLEQLGQFLMTQKIHKYDAVVRYKGAC